MRNLFLISMVSLSLSCGPEKKEERSAEGSKPKINPSALNLTTGSEVMSFALDAVESATSAESPAFTGSVGALNLPQVGLRLSEDTTEVHPDDPNCSEHGEPWDEDKEGDSKKLEVWDAKYAVRTFYCQLGVDTADTVKGSLMQQKGLLCEAERSLDGELEYSEEGIEKPVKVLPSENCFSGNNLSQMLEEMPEGGYPAKLTAYSLSNSEWHKRLVFNMEEMGFKYEIYFTVEYPHIAFKVKETWSQQERIESGDYNHKVDSNATGISGGSIALNLEKGTLLAETINTYWGRRVRLYVQGAYDPDTLEFGEISKMEGIYGDMYIPAGEPSNTSKDVFGSVATVKGTAENGFQYGSYSVMCLDQEREMNGMMFPVCNSTGTGDGIATSKMNFHTAHTACLPTTADCDGLSRIEFGSFSENDYQFLAISPLFDAFSGSRETIEASYDAMNIPCFEEVSKDPVLTSSCDS